MLYHPFKVMIQLLHRLTSHKTILNLWQSWSPVRKAFQKESTATKTTFS